MRITNNMLCDDFLYDMQSNLGNMQTLQSQLTSGKQIRVPSDDPFKAARILQINTTIGQGKQYNENINDASNWLQATDTSLGELTNTVQRVRELLIASGDAAYGKSELKTIKDEINQKVGEVAQIMNSSFDGKFLFGGTKASSRPLTVEADAKGNNKISYNGDANGIANIDTKMKLEISQGVDMEYNVTAPDVFKLKGKDKDGNPLTLSSVLSNILTNLSAVNETGKKTTTPGTGTATAGATGKTTATDPRKELITTDLTNITEALSNILKVRAEVGAKQNRMQSALNNNESANYNLTNILSKTQDIDFTKKTMEMATARTVYMASLQTSAKIIEPTLLDFLR